MDKALENYQSLQHCVDMIPAPILLMQDTKKGLTTNSSIANQKLLLLLTGSDKVNALIIKDLMTQKILKNIQTKETVSLKSLIQQSSSSIKVLNSDDNQSLYKLNLPHIKDKCFIIKQESIRDMKKGDLLTVFIFIDFTNIRNKIKETIAKDYRTLYYTSVAHDIKTPINGIMGTNQALLKSASNDRDMRKLLMTQSHCCKSLMYYSNSIQDLASLENGQFKIEKDFFQMRRSLNDVLNMLQEQLGNRSVKINFFCNNNVPDLIYSDVRRIKQVLYHLVTNAVKYTSKGIIKVSVSISDSLPILGIQRPALLKQQSVIDEVDEEEKEISPVNRSNSKARRSLSLTQIKQDDIRKQKSLKQSVLQSRNSVKRQTVCIKSNMKSDHGDGGTGGAEIPIKFKLESEQHSPDRSEGSDESFNDTSNPSSILVNTELLNQAAFTNGCSRYLKLEVQDSGIGIKRQDLRKLFDLFQKTGSNVHMSDHTGVGIGLTLCKKVCEELGGMIQLRSKVKQGSTFSCYFNISQPPENLEQSSTSSSKSKNSSKSSQTLKSSSSSQDDQAQPKPSQHSSKQVIVRKQSPLKDIERSSSSSSNTSSINSPLKLNIKHNDSEEESNDSQGQQQILFNLDNSILNKSVQKSQFPIRMSQQIQQYQQNKECNDTIEDDKEIPDEEDHKNNYILQQSRSLLIKESRFKFNYLEESKYQSRSQFVEQKVSTKVMNHIFEQYEQNKITQQVQGCECTGQVLLIDDNQFNQTTASLIFKSNFGVSCDLAYDGQEGYEKILKKKECRGCSGTYKIIVVDINMPILNGFELMMKLQQAEKNNLIKLSDSYYIAHTALPKISLNNYEQYGFNMYMGKPMKARIIEKLMKNLQLIPE
eukprot:403341058